MPPPPPCCPTPADETLTATLNRIESTLVALADDVADVRRRVEAR